MFRGRTSQPAKDTGVVLVQESKTELILPCGVTPQIHHLLFLPRQTSPRILSELHKTNMSGLPSSPTGPIAHLRWKTMLGQKHLKASVSPCPFPAPRLHSSSIFSRTSAGNPSYRVSSTSSPDFLSPLQSPSSSGRASSRLPLSSRRLRVRRAATWGES